MVTPLAGASTSAARKSLSPNPPPPTHPHLQRRSPRSRSPPIVLPSTRVNPRVSPGLPRSKPFNRSRSRHRRRNRFHGRRSRFFYNLYAHRQRGGWEHRHPIAYLRQCSPSQRNSENVSLDQLFLEEVRDAYFDYDSAEIDCVAREALRRTANFLRGCPQMHVTIEGHCDERGSTEYKLALGDRRANAVKQYLISLGIPDERFNTVSFGKEKPFCTEAREACPTRQKSSRPFRPG